jgi:hypothetical protein
VVLLAVAALYLAASDQTDALRFRGESVERFLTPLRERIGRVEQAGARPAPAAVALFGDSISWSAGDTIAQRFGASDAALELVPVTTAMLRPVHFVYLLDEALRARPAAALVEVNVVWFGNPRVVDVRWQTRLSRHLRAERAVRLLPALADELASPFDPWLFRAAERTGLLFALDDVRHATTEALDATGRRLNLALGLRTEPMGGQEFPLDWLGAAYAHDYVATPSTGFLRELLRGFHDAEVPVVLFVPPINQVELAALGMPAPDDLPERIERLREAVGARPDEWLDLHALVPPEEFRDVVGHLDPAGKELLATALAAAVEARLEKR